MPRTRGCLLPHIHHHRNKNLPYCHTCRPRRCTLPVLLQFIHGSDPCLNSFQNLLQHITMPLLRIHTYCNITPSSRQFPSPACSSCSQISILASQTATNSVFRFSHSRIPYQIHPSSESCNTQAQCNMVIDLGCGGHFAPQSGNSLKIALSSEQLVLLTLLISWEVHDESVGKRSPGTGKHHCRPSDLYEKGSSSVAAKKNTT
ncbi:hypothetical protein F4604DRAFT_1119405 [Suillus subluteus]|nr:hypothetical protein F4604DRAFT_1119405 [Suillus subluteus]